MERALSYPLSPIPWALGTPDGLPTKTNKAQLLHKLEDARAHSTERAEVEIHIVDGSAIIHALSDVPATFGGVAKKVFDKLPKAKRVDFVTDSYKEHSIKTAEHKRRGESEQFIVKGPLTRVPKDWKAFLQNETNKERLLELIFEEWQKDQYAEGLRDRHIYFTLKEACFCLTSSDGNSVKVEEVRDLFSSQEEADTILHSLSADKSESAIIVVHSPDTDVFILLLHYSEFFDNDVYFETGTGNSRRRINIKTTMTIHGHDVCKALLGIHAVSGCDSTSAFVRKGKVKPLKLGKQEEFLQAFLELGTDVSLCDALASKLEHFACKLYSAKNYTDINKLRYDTYKQRFTSTQVLSTEGMDLSLLPPSRSSLVMHLQRANYQVMVWKKAHVQFPTTPSPIGHGWKLDEGQLVIDWCQGDILPQVRIFVA